MKCASKKAAANPNALRELTARGTQLLRAGDAVGALDAFDAALRLAPSDPAGLQGRGLALHAAGDTGRALDTFRIASRLPANWKAWESIADITPGEAERIHAITKASILLEAACNKGAPPAGLVERCYQALLCAHRFDDAARFVRARRAEFTSLAAAGAALARAEYHGGDFAGAFSAQARALLDLNPGSLPGEPSRPGLNPGAAAEAARDLIFLLGHHGADAFLAAGTLLGFVRQGGPLPHDRDIDIGIILRPGQTPDIAGLIRAHPQILLPRIARPGDRYFGIRFKGVAADIFLYEPHADGLVCGLGSQPGDIQWRFSGFRPVLQTFGGEAWPVPEDPARHLSETYGPGWKIPDRGFASAVRSPALFATDPFARAYYAAARAFRAWRAGDLHKAAALQRQSPVPFALPPERGSLPG